MAKVYKPYAYQEYAQNEIIEKPNIGLFLDMGLGKTVITLTALHDLKFNRWAVNKILIIAEEGCRRYLAGRGAKVAASTGLPRGRSAGISYTTGKRACYSGRHLRYQPREYAMACAVLRAKLAV